MHGPSAQSSFVEFPPFVIQIELESWIHEVKRQHAFLCISICPIKLVAGRLAMSLL